MLTFLVDHTVITLTTHLIGLLEGFQQLLTLTIDSVYEIQPTTVLRLHYNFIGITKLIATYGDVILENILFWWG
mgnify:CR=1 FL=1